MIGSCSGTHISNQVVVAQRDLAGLVTIGQGKSSVTFADRDALRVAKAILAAAGYDGISFYRNLGRVFVDGGDDDPPHDQSKSGSIR
jgi:hypothetical protein